VGKSASRTEPVRLRGRPHRRAALVPPAAATPDPVRVLLSGVEPQRARIRPVGPAGAAAELRLKVPPTTPPGTYEGSVEVGELRFPILVDVEPHLRMRFTPRSLTVREPAGTEHVTEVSVVNHGNVPCEVPERDSFCLFEWAGVERGLRVALSSDEPKGHTRLDVLMGQLARSFGGMVEVTVADGSGELQIGEARALLVTLFLPEKLRPSHVYMGTWSPCGARLSMRIEASSRAAAS
jgi:hypothetical protein